MAWDGMNLNVTVWYALVLWVLYGMVSYGVIWYVCKVWYAMHVRCGMFCLLCCVMLCM